jgi:hypothetical protein
MSETGNTRRGWAVPLLVAGVLLLIVAAALFAFLRSRTGGSPRIAAEPGQIDYGDVKFGAEQQIRIRVSNTGSGVLRFAEAPSIEVLEGC